MASSASLDFDGSSDYIATSANTIASGATALTVMAFARCESYTNINQAIFQHGTTNLEEIILGPYRTPNELFFGMKNNAGVTAFIKSTGVSGSLNTWYHWCFTWDNAVGSSLLSGSKFFQDGVSGSIVDVFGATATMTQVNTTSNVNEIGRRLPNTGTWDGQIAHVKLYNRALTQPEIIECKNNPSAIPRGLVGWWPLWNTDCLDLSSGRDNGTITGSVVSSTRGPAYFL